MTRGSCAIPVPACKQAGRQRNNSPGPSNISVTGGPPELPPGAPPYRHYRFHPCLLSRLVSRTRCLIDPLAEVLNLHRLERHLHGTDGTVAFVPRQLKDIGL